MKVLNMNPAVKRGPRTKDWEPRRREGITQHVNMLRTVNRMWIQRTEKFLGLEAASMEPDVDFGSCTTFGKAERNW